MSPDRQHRGARRRAASRFPRRSLAPQPVMTLDRILALPFVDGMLSRLLGYPRALQLGGILVGIVMVLLAVRPLIWPAAMPKDTVAAPLPTSVAPVLQPAANDGTEEVLNVVAAYNQASITAALVGRADVMAPYLAPDGTAWTEVQAEYQCRLARGETHEPTLTHWGVLQVAATGDTARVETQEQWDDITSVGGEVLSSRRGILTHNTYELRRAATGGRWQIMTVTSVSVIG